MTIPIIAGPYRTFRDLNPNETYMEYEGSTITIPIRAQLPGGKWEEERLKLRAYMRLEVFPPYMNGLGTREFQFIIRDWELFGYSPLLNKVFMGNERGHRAPGTDLATPNEQAVMTFSIAHHYEKSGDDDNRNLGNTNDLLIDDVTHHEHDGHGNIYWHIDGSDKAGYTVRFFRQRLPQNPFDERSDEHLNLLCAKVEGAKPGQRFVASGGNNGRQLVPSLGNAVLHPNLQLRTPLSISWALGSAPMAGTSGRIHIVSPAKSLCIAGQGPDIGHPVDSADFPARITYSASYHIHVNNTTFVEDQAGVAVADGVQEIPPRDVVVAFEKPQAGYVLGRYLQFSAGKCGGMEPISETQFRAGKAMARHWRAARLDVQQGQPPSAPPSLV